jgi:hypothetical protein
MNKPYRFLLVQAFHLPKESPYLHRAVEGPDRHCASIRNINYPLPRPPGTGHSEVHLAKNRAQRGEHSEVVEAALREALAKAMVDLGVSASGLVYPSAKPKKWRRKKLF